MSGVFDGIVEGAIGGGLIGGLIVLCFGDLSKLEIGVHFVAVAGFCVAAMLWRLCRLLGDAESRRHR